MMHSYPNDEYSRASAWHHLLHHRPTWSVDGHVFIPDDGGFRKEHTENEWVWYVHRWVYQGPFTHNQPCSAPPACTLTREYLVGGTRTLEVRYFWATWLHPVTKDDQCGFLSTLPLL